MARRIFDDRYCVPTYNITVPNYDDEYLQQLPQTFPDNYITPIPKECPDDTKEIHYTEKKYGRTIRGLTPDVRQVLTNDILYGKPTVTTNRMIKPELRGKEFDPDMRSNYIYWLTCYKGVRWARLQRICDTWGVKLVRDD